jgi:putative transposase
MIDPEHKLPVSRQAAVLELSRSSVYYKPVPISDADLGLMRRIDKLHLEYPFMGSRMLKRQLKEQGFEVGRKPVATLMKRMGIEAL